MGDKVLLRSINRINTMSDTQGITVTLMLFWVNSKRFSKKLPIVDPRNQFIGHNISFVSMSFSRNTQTKEVVG